MKDICSVEGHCSSGGDQPTWGHFFERLKCEKERVDRKRSREILGVGTVSKHFGNIEFWDWWFLIYDI